VEKRYKEDTRVNLLKALSWQIALRDDAEIVKALSSGEEVDGIYSISETGLMDEYFYYLNKKGILQLLESMKPTDIEREMVPFHFFTLLYWLKILKGIESMNALPDILFSDENWMKWVGFNAHQIENGICERGKFRKKDGTEREGPICINTLADNIEKISFRGMEAFYNRSIKILAKDGVFGKKVSLIVDTTDYEVTEKYEGCESVTRKEKVKNKFGKIETIEKTVYGWKIGAVFHASSKIPVAVKIDKINVPDNHFTRRLVEQALTNLQEVKIDEITIDRGFLDGEDLYWLKGLGIAFVIPAKKDMDVYNDANAIAEKYGDDKTSPEVVVKKREIPKRRGNGKNTHEEILITEVVGVPDLLSYSQYGPKGHGDRKNCKDFKPNPINAVVVRKWENKEFKPDKRKVFLTNYEVKDPFKAFDSYDDRSLIENGLFREWKQKWFLEHPPKKTEKAIIAHVYLTAVAMATTWAYRNWKEKQDKAMDEGKTPGIEIYRRKLEAENREKVVVMLGNKYGIIYVQELAILAGIRIKDPSKYIVGPREEIMRKYGVIPSFT
jgi:hypothetical protein